ncbi:MAG: MBL fold metallo-hydrolase [Vicinamibacterales bacterium]
MPLSVTILGGSAAWPNPGQGCSSYLVSDGQTSVLLDCGPDTLLELRKHADYTALDAIVVSHCHADHILDLVPYRYGLIYGPRRSSRRIPVWLPPGGITRLTMLASAFDGQGEPASAFWDPAFALAEYDPSSSLQINELALSFASTQHFVECYAIRVDSTDGRALVYSSDTGSIDPLKGLVMGADVVIAEATVEHHDDRPAETRGHITPEDAACLAVAAGARALVVTHLWSERSDDVVRKEASASFDGEVLIAKPGLRVDV